MPLAKTATIESHRTDLTSKGISESETTPSGAGSDKGKTVVSSKSASDKSAVDCGTDSTGLFSQWLRSYSFRVT